MYLNMDIMLQRWEYAASEGWKYKTPQPICFHRGLLLPTTPSVSKESVRYFKGR
jgi:hypothetical protein